MSQDMKTWLLGALGNGDAGFPTWQSVGGTIHYRDGSPSQEMFVRLFVGTTGVWLDIDAPPTPGSDEVKVERIIFVPFDRIKELSFPPP